MPLAALLDGMVSRLLDPKEQGGEAPSFKSWFVRASHNHLALGDQFFGFHCFNLQLENGKSFHTVLADTIDTPGGDGNFRRGAYAYFYTGSIDATEIVSVPLVYFLRKCGPVDGKYTLYEHGAVNYNQSAIDAFNMFRESKKWTNPMPDEPHGGNGMIYVGITGRPWATRYSEHVRQAAAGSMLPFHRALREDFGRYNTRFHYVLGVLPDKDSAMDNEEEFVAIRSLYPKGLNAIPGGRAGIRYLASINAIRTGESIVPGCQEDILANHILNETRAGKPNPLMSALWKSEEYAMKAITSQENRLSIEQVRIARYELTLGRSAEEVCRIVGARNIDVIRRLAAGKTYNRVV